MSEQFQVSAPSQADTDPRQNPEDPTVLTSADLAAVVALLTETAIPAVTVVEGSEEGRMF